METIDYIKEEIKRLYETNPSIHVSVKAAQPKATVKNMPAIITGAYKCIFQIKEGANGRYRNHTFQYNDVLVGQIVIDEIGYKPLANPTKKK
ncbi:MAG: hypothetical protein IJ033_05495 [Clostridia bacterium]|nr:hypothetical protein [Clostridia bacterium]